jgi:glucosyl-3-phosphoglycerate synthase
MKYFKYQDFNIKDLIKIKKKLGLTIGVGLPVLNEEKTLANVIKVIKKCGELVDEVVIIDSNSSDSSKKIAKKLNVRVVEDNKAAKKLGVKLNRGKGLNLWSSLYYLKTDIILWIDTDIENIHPRFIYGLAAPLIFDKNIQFVKGFYHRPKGDSRVTEIMVRPFLNYIFPEAKDFIQPLSGEYGGRREFLEKIIFYSGYGVESAVLLQALHNLKGKEVAQVYLGRRVHELQDVSSLGIMGASILRPLLDLAQKYGRIKVNSKSPDILVQYDSLDGLSFFPVGRKLSVDVLPAMIKNTTYRNKFYN